MKRKLNKHQKLINKFIKDPSEIWKNRGNIKREMALGKKLYALVDSEKFWTESHLLNDKGAPFKVNSLAYFLTEDGIKWVNSEALRIKLKLPKPVVYSLEQDKIGQDAKINKTKKTTLMDFLKDAS